MWRIYWHEAVVWYRRNVAHPIRTVRADMMIFVSLAKLYLKLGKADCLLPLAEELVCNPAALRLRFAEELRFNAMLDAGWRKRH